MNKQKDKKDVPEWTNRAEHITHKPKWKDKIPRSLWKLGEVFFPIPRGKKGWNYPHHVDEFRYAADSETLNAYFDAGWGYGIACANDLIVIDIDDLGYVETITEHLPSTVYQITGSRSGVHFFYICKGVTTRKTLFDKFLGEKVHIGEVKADNNGYVVGPGSQHPSGNIYGPLKGDSITEIKKDDLMAAISDYLIENISDDRWGQEQDREIDTTQTHELYNVTADDIAPWLETEERIAHPIHGSSSGHNFMKNDDGETFVCWRCQVGRGDGCILNGAHMLAMEQAQERGELQGGDYCCEWIRNNWHSDPRLHYYAWEKAIDDGLIKTYNIPSRVVKGYCVHNNIIEKGESLIREQYFDVINLLEWLVTSKIGDAPKLH